MIYAAPGTENSVVSFKSRYENFIGGEWVAPVKGQYFDNVSPVNNEKFCENSIYMDLAVLIRESNEVATQWLRSTEKLPF